MSTINYLYQRHPLVGDTMKLFAAAQSGEVNMLEKLLLKKKRNVNLTDKNGNIALHVAIEAGQVKSVEILLNYGADVNLPVKRSIINDPQSSPLAWTINRGDREIVELLLNKGAKLKPNEGSVLHLACQHTNHAININIYFQLTTSIPVVSTNKK